MKKEKKYINDYAQLMTEWDWDRNNDIGLNPQTLTYGSGVKAYWICSKCGNSWLASITHRTHGRDCPKCKNIMLSDSRSIPRNNKLCITHPHLEKEWDVSKNELSFFDYSTYSNKKVWWICEEGHSWEESVSHRTRRNDGCPYCSNHRVLTGFNDLETKFPEVALEWNYEKNDGIVPGNVLAGSNKKYWWKCPYGHEWEASVVNRTNKNTGCPVCSKEKRISIPEKTIYFYLKDIFPDIQEQAKFEWLKPRELDIYIPSLRVAIEYDGQYWHTDVKNDVKKEKLCRRYNIDLIRIREPNCQAYTGKCKCIQTDNPRKKDFLKTALVELFDYFNERYHININLNYDFKRDFIKIQELVVSYEKNNSLLVKFPEIAKEWNYDKNGNLTPDLFSHSSNQPLWWKCVKGHEWIATISDRTRTSKNGCPFCSNKRVLKGYNDLKTVYPQIASEWDYEKNDLVPDEVLYGSPKKVWWRCKKGHVWQAAIVNRTRNNLGCPVCSNHKVLPDYNDLESNYPDIASEWDHEKNTFLTPNQVSFHYDNKVWWLCSKGHSYEATVFDRVERERGCPYCSSNKVLPGFNDLESLFPDVARSWNYEKNDGIMPSQVAAHSNKKYWWKCQYGHEWETTVGNRTKGKECPYCSNQKVLKGYNDLATLYPEIALEWDYENNNDSPDEYFAGSSKKVSWKCSKGHTWKAVIRYRTKGGTGCPVCYEIKRKSK